jgi:hypothetical protein
VDAISFYLKNAVMAEICLKHDSDADLGPLDELIEEYQRTVRLAGLRMFYYLTLICTRESRHVGSSIVPYVKSTYPCGDFLEHIRGSNETAAVDSFRLQPPPGSFGDYTNMLVDVFKKGTFSGGFGGKPWMNVAVVLREFVHGSNSMEILLDTAFTLAHNNGPIFNKQMLFMHYSLPELTKILDVQRAGMIPQFVNGCESQFVMAEHTAFMQRVKALLPDSFHGPVDWQKVQDLGAVGHYASKKKSKPLSNNYLYVTPKYAAKKVKVSRKGVKAA